MLAAALAVAGTTLLAAISPAEELTPPPKRIVILGSSTAAGGVASSYANSWAGRLAAALAPRGYVVFNVSISGNNTQDTINRFVADVAAAKPDFVVLATSIINEGSAAAPHAAYETYKANLLRLIGMAKAIGATPVVIGQYPNSGYGAPHKAMVRQLYADLDAWGLQTWDFWNAVADANGDWAAGLTRDGTHPLDAGHAYMFDAIPLTFFDTGYKGEFPRTGAWVFTGENASITGPLQIQLDRPAGSWTQAAWISSWIDSRAVFFSNDAGLSVTNEGMVFQVAGEDGRILLSSNIGTQDGIPRHLCLTYQEATNLLSFAIDGVPIAGTRFVPAARASNFIFLGKSGTPETNCAGCAVATPVVYRSALNAADVGALTAGRVLWKSLEAWLPLDEPAHPAPRNLANTAVKAVASGAWKTLPPPASETAGPAPADASR